MQACKPQAKPHPVRPREVQLEVRLRPLRRVAPPKTISPAALRLRSLNPRCLPRVHVAQRVYETLEERFEYNCAQ